MAKSKTDSNINEPNGTTETIDDYVSEDLAAAMEGGTVVFDRNLVDEPVSKPDEPSAPTYPAEPQPIEDEEI